MDKHHILLEHYLIEVLIQDHFQSKGILLENQLDEGKLKDFIKSVKTNFKSSLRPKFNNLLKGLELTGKPATAISFLSTLKNLDIDLTDKKELAAAVAYLKNKTKLKEAEGDVIEKNGKKFVETVDPFSGETLLIPEKDYERVGDKLEKGGSGVIGKLSKFFNDTRLGKVLKGVLIAAPLFAGLADEIGDAAEQVGQAAGLGDLDITGNDAPSAETIRGLMNAGFSSEEIQNYLDSQFAVDTGGQEGGVVDDVKDALEPVDAADLATDSNEIADAKSQGLDVSPSGDETVNFTTFEHASSVLDQGDKDKISTENSAIVKYLQNGQDYGETVLGASSNTGANANVDKNGGDLNANRLNNTADFILDDLESQLKDQGVDYTRTGDTINVTDGGSYTLERAGVNDPGDLSSIDRTDDTATQSAIRVGTAGEPPEPTRLFGFDPVRPEKTPPAKPGEPKPGEPKPDDKKPEEEKVVPVPETIKVIYPGNRLHQYAMLSQLMNGINFFKSIGATADPRAGRPITDAIISAENTGIIKYASSYTGKGNLNGPDGKLTKQIYDKTLSNLGKNNWSKADATKLLNTLTTKEGNQIQGIARWIISSRKDPDRIIDFLNNTFPGLEIEQRDKAFFTIRENYTPILIGKLEDLPGYDKSLVQQNLAQIVGLVTSMYFGAKKGTPLTFNNEWLKDNAGDYNKMKSFIRIVGKGYGVIPDTGFDPSGLPGGKVLAGMPQALSGPGAGKGTPTQALDKKPDGVEKDAVVVNKQIGKVSAAKTRLALINTKAELQLLLKNILMLTNQNFAKQDSSIKSYMMAISNQIKAVKEGNEDLDVSKVMKVLMAPTIRNYILRINNKDELKDLIVNVILPNVHPSLRKNLAAMRGAVIGAGNAYKYDASELDEMSKKKIRQRDKLAKDIKSSTIKQYGKKEGESAAYAIATNMVKEKDCGCGKGANCESLNTNSVINELIEDLVYEELCKRGKAYIAARKRAGEKSSAYLSGRAVKVCKGQMKGAGGKRKKSYRKKKRKRKTNEALYNQLRPQVLRHLEETFFNHPEFAIIAEYNVIEDKVNESLKNWFGKEDWVRIDTQGNIAGKCGTMPKGKATQRCLPRAKANSLTKKQRAATSRKKVRGSKKGKQFVKNTKKAKVSFKKK